MIYELTIHTLIWSPLIKYSSVRSCFAFPRRLCPFSWIVFLDRRSAFTVSVSSRILYTLTARGYTEILVLGFISERSYYFAISDCPPGFFLNCNVPNLSLLAPNLLSNKRLFLQCEHPKIFFVRQRMILLSSTNTLLGFLVLLTRVVSTHSHSHISLCFLIEAFAARGGMGMRGRGRGRMPVPGPQGVPGMPPTGEFPQGMDERWEIVNNKLLRLCWRAST